MDAAPVPFADSSATQDLIAEGRTSAIDSSAHRGATRWDHALSRAALVVAFSRVAELSHGAARAPTVTRPAAAATKLPVSLETSTVDAQSRASRLVLNPLLSVVRRSGVR
jgi:hypothetical protein